MKIQLIDISKTFDRKDQVLSHLNLVIESGSLTTLLGSSGCGKTTLLRIISGLETPDTGKIIIGDQVVFDKEKGINIPPYQRGIGFVFQDFALWPNMTVLNNVEFGLRDRTPLFQKKDRSTLTQAWKDRQIKEGAGATDQRKAKGARLFFAKLGFFFQYVFYLKPRELINRLFFRNKSIKARALECLKMVKMDAYQDKLPSQLSGGQKQRVAIARAIAINPDILLFDEPLSALDALLRESMRTEIRSLVKSLHITAVFVTHDQEEAMSIADQIILMSKGKIVEAGQPEEIYWNPKTRFTASFIGKSSWLDETRFLRPESLRLTSVTGDVRVEATVDDSQYKGGRYIDYAHSGDQSFIFYSTTQLDRDSSVTIYYNPQDIKVITTK
mgnify:CR=1 FL=1